MYTSAYSYLKLVPHALAKLLQLLFVFRHLLTNVDNDDLLLLWDDTLGLLGVHNERRESERGNTAINFRVESA
jgi:hypothetical protein